MGNHVCTDAVPFTMEDIDITLHGQPGDNIERDHILPAETLELFSAVDHNIKAFRFYYQQPKPSSPAGKRPGTGNVTPRHARPTSSSAGKTLRKTPAPTDPQRRHTEDTPTPTPAAAPDPAGGASTTASDALVSAHVKCEPIALSKSRIVVRPSEVVLLLHLQRFPLGGGGGSSTGNSARSFPPPTSRQRDADADRYGPDTAPAWARDMTVLFTPRGLAVSFSTDIGKPVWSSAAPTPATPGGSGASPAPTPRRPGPTPRAPEFEFRYSLHLLTGRVAHPLVAAMAVLHALQLERQMTESTELVRRLFYNYNLGKLLSCEAEGRAKASGRAGRGSVLQGMRHTRQTVLITRPTTIGQIVPEESGGTFHSGGGGGGGGYFPLGGSARLRTLQEVYARNCLLRMLHAARGGGGGGLSRGGSPRSPALALSATGASTTGPPALGVISRHGRDRNGGEGAGEGQQGPPAAEIPRLRYAHKDTRRPSDASTTAGSGGSGGSGAAAAAAAAAPKEATPRTPRQSLTDGHPHYPPPPSANNKRASEAAAGGGAVPVMASLKIEETLQQRGNQQMRYDRGAGAAAASTAPATSAASAAKGTTGGVAGKTKAGGGGGEPLDSCEDEIRMSEDRVNRLKKAAPEATEVLPWLFVGGEEAARDRAQLLLKGITAVVNTVAFDIGNLHNDVFEYLSLYLCDSPDEPIFSLFPVVTRFIEEQRTQGGKVFIHCHQGVSRSCSFVIAYVMWQRGLCYDRAYEFVRARRQVCSPNTGFYVNLHLWEDQLSRPVLNKGYAFVPYTASYIFPYSFRLAVAFRRHRDAHDDDNASIINEFVQTIDEEGTSYVLDRRLCYGFLFGERCEDQSPRQQQKAAGDARAKGYTSSSIRSRQTAKGAAGGGAPQGDGSLHTFLFYGPDSDAVVRERAAAEWPSFVAYNFYQGPTTESVNDKGERIVFTALPPVSEMGRRAEASAGGGDDGDEAAAPPAPTVPVASLASDVQQRAQQYMHAGGAGAGGFASASGGVRPRGSARCARDGRWDSLLARSDLVFTFASHLAEEQRVRMAARGRKRARQEEVRRLQQHQQQQQHHHPPSRRAPGTPPTTGKLPTPPVTPPLTASAPRPAPTGFAALPRDTGDAAPEAPRGGRTDSGTPAAAAAAAPPPDIEIRAYPFDGAPLRDVLGMEDLSSEGCYAIIVPAAPSNEDDCSHAFLWIGAACGVSEADAVNAYHENLCLPVEEEAEEEEEDGRAAIRLASGLVLTDVLGELVAEGEEPDELLVALD